MGWQSRSQARPTAAALCVVLALGVRAALADGATFDEFEARVRPVLVEHCQKCHGPEKQKGGLRLDSREALLRGGESGPAAVPGRPGESRLIEAVNYGETVQMPPKSRLGKGEVEALTRWVAAGLPWPGSTANGPAPAPAAGFDLAARRAAHWAWRPIADPSVPPVARADWPLGPIDAFVLASLEAHGLEPAPDADRRALLRRATFDLTGLPPTPHEQAQFLDDTSPLAFERLVDRLLDSPRFGERWGRHWLDLVRYGESRGHEFDPIIPNAYQYRDYVVRALNADVPYDRFLTEHVAGDLLPTPRTDPGTGANESALGTGFWFLGEEVHSPVDIRQDEADRFDNRIDVLTKTFLGLTVSCARCHDHKFDAISQRDYYALSGFLASSSYRQMRFATEAQEKRLAVALDALKAEANARVRPLVGRALIPELGRFADKLLEARAALAPGAPPCPESVRPWVAELEAARGDLQHPLHPFVAVACAPGADDPGQFRALLASQFPAASPWSPRSGSATGPGPKVVADFGRVTDLTRLQDGVSFGLRPGRAGDITVAAGPDGRPRFGLLTLGAAGQDRLWSSLASDPKAERDQGRLGTWDRSGKTLRTPDFALESGRLWYLTDGPGRAYAAVNSHLIIAGPLHAALLTEWAAGPKSWRWVRHDLPDYKGRHTHVEFSPAGGHPLSVAMVVDYETEPPAFFEGVNPRLAAAVGGPAVTTPDALAQAYQALFVEVARRLGEESARETAPDEARLGHWLVSRSSALFPEETPARRAAEDEAARWLAALGSLGRQLPGPSPLAPAMLDGTGCDENLFIRGSSKTLGPAVPRRFLEALDGEAPIRPEGECGSGRLELARSLLDPANPFTRRVAVNRVWHHLFGRGLVASVDNFGVLGEAPTHPELLDYLAGQFAREGWSVKRLVRSVMLSRAYRMSSRPDPSGDAADPNNRLLHRASIRRLEAEPLRDAILSVSGRLDGALAGPSVPVHLTPFLQGRGRPASGPLDGGGRRSLYLATRRNFLSPMMLAFDAPIPFSTVGRRNVSNVPAQALMLMNDPFVFAEAERWAGRVLAGPGCEPAARVEGMYRAAFARAPSPAETRDALDFLAAQGTEYALGAGSWATDRRPWADLAHVLLNSKEFLFLD